VSSTARGAILLLVGLLLWTVAPVAAGWSSTVVMSNSMAPGVLAGDVLLVRPVAPTELRPGQILLVDDPDRAGRLRLHRLTRVDPATGALTLKGDANERADSTTVQTDAVHGVAALRVPWVGSPLVWLQEGRVRLLAALAAALTALAAGISCYRPPPAGPHFPTRRRTSTTRDRASGSTGAASENASAEGWLTGDGTVIADRTDTRPLYRVTELADMTPGQAAAGGGAGSRPGSR
jgi:signal peptidase